MDKRVGGCVCDDAWFRHDCSAMPVALNVSGNTSECDDGRTLRITTAAALPGKQYLVPLWIDDAVH